MACFVDQAWLDAITGKVFFYPAAGTDWGEALDAFAGHIDTFWFADINYPRGLRMGPVQGLTSQFQLLQPSVRSGKLNAVMEQREGYRFLAPSKLAETYERVGDRKRITVIRRRGFGQNALSTEFADGSVGVFMHRGDSPGEGGSNVYFLANKRSRHEPVSNLFDKLSRRLAKRALVVSDGSNSDIKGVKRWHRRQRVKGHEAFREARASGFEHGGWSWECVGYLGEGPTLIWGLTRLPK